MKFLLCLFVFISFYSYSIPNQENQDALYLMAELASFEGNYSQALKFLDRMESHKSPTIQLRKAQELKNKGLTFESQKIARFLIQNFPENKWVQVQSYLLLGEIYESLELFRKALVQYERILALNPSHPSALLRHSLILVQMGYPLSLERESLFKENFSFYRALGDIYLKGGFKKKALEAFKKSLSLNPSDRHSAWRFFQMEKPLNYIQFVEHLNSPDSFVVSLIGRSHLKRNERQQAQMYLEDLLWSDHSILDLKAEWVMGHL